MKIESIIACGLAAFAGVAIASPASPYTETFSVDGANWRNGSSTAVDWNAGGYASTTADLNSAGSFGLTLFRAQDGFDSSGDAFVGDYIAGGISSISFDIRQNSGQDLTFALRVATSNNFPGFAVISPTAVASGEWTTLTFDLDYTSPFYFAEGAPGETFFNSVMTVVGNLQISVDRPDGLSTPLNVTFDVDNFATLVPAPGAMGLLGLGGLVAARRRRA